MVESRSASRRASAFVVLLAVTALVLAAFGQRSADATHQTVTEVEGSAFGCYGNTQFSGGAPVVTGPLPAVELPPGGGSETATAPTCDIFVFPGGPTVISTGPLTVSTQGTTGPTGSVTSTANIANVNRSGNEAFTATNVSSTCTADETGVSGSTTITGGRIETSPGVFEDVPENPEPGYTVFVNLGVATANYIFNEQIIDPDTGSITVNALRIQPLTGPLTGTVIIGQVVCDVTTVAQETTTTTVPEETTTTTVPEETTTTTVPQETTTTTVPQETTTTTVPQETTTTTVPQQTTTTTVPQETTTTTTGAGAACVPGEEGAKPGYGHGDKNHRHCGPPGLTGNRPGNAERGVDGRPVSNSRNVPPAWLLAGLGVLFLAPLIVPFRRSRRGGDRA